MAKAFKIKRTTKTIVIVVIIIISLIIIFMTSRKPERYLTLEERYIYYFPIFGYDATFTRKIHSFQIGWDDESERVFEYQDALGLTHGFDQHLLDDYDLVTVQIEEWYLWYNLAYGDRRGTIAPHALTYNKAEKRFMLETEAIEWIQEHPNKWYVIGNEPDCDLSEGNEANTMTEGEYAEFLHKSIQLIRGADPSAKIMVGAWAGGIGETPSFAHNENDMMKIYNSRYGELIVDGFSFHVYQRYSCNYAYPADKLRKFATFVKSWYDSGLATTSDVYLTEFGWYGIDYIGNTKENNICFMNWYIPQLRAHEQVKGWWWWEWGMGSLLIYNNEPTDVGRHYSEMEK
jgi:hypothetical protein